jgi:hypothetical protein
MAHLLFRGNPYFSIHSSNVFLNYMKHLLLAASFLLAFTIVRAQAIIELGLTPKVGVQPFALNQAFLDYSGKTASLSRVHFYLCNFELVHDGGQVTALPNVYLLANPGREFYTLATVTNVTQVEKVRFSVGVDAAVNHDNPSGWPSGHPLSFQSPSQHWGWSSGYLFSTFEGDADSDNNGTTDTQWEIHSLGDQLLRDVEVNVQPQSAMNVITLPLEYDLQAWLRGLNLATVGSQHSSSGAALSSANNIVTYQVFRSAGTVGVTDPQRVPLLSFDLFDSERPVVYWDAQGVEAVSLEIHDLNGQVVFRADGLATAGRQRIERKLAAGMYICSLSHQGDAIKTKKFMVMQ